jgi:flagellar basal-body rod modification protein FlgD
MSTSSSLIGKHVEVSEEDENKENYKGIVKSAHIEDGIVYIDIQIDKTDEVKSFEYGTVLKVSENDK